MARIWKEQYDWTKHRNRMWGEGCAVETTPDPKLIPQWVYFVNVCSFTFEFHSIPQIKACLTYYSQKLHPSTIISRSDLPNYGCDHSEVQRWFERLPQKLLEEPNRLRVVKALEKALKEFRNKEE